MPKTLHAITVLIIASSLLQESNNTRTKTPREVPKEDHTEMHPSSTASLSTHSTLTTDSSSSLNLTLRKTHPTPQTSIPPTATYSQTYTLSHDKITTTEQTKTDSTVSKSNGTTASRPTKFTSVTTIQSSSGEPGKTAASTEKTNTTPISASSNIGGDSLARNPGLVAILCIFFIVLALVIVTAIAKLISYRRSSQFERLENVPMNKMNEDSPFAQYPPK